MAELTVAVVGCGPAGGVHLACWSSLIGVRVAAVCDKDGVIAAHTAALYLGAAAFTDVRAMLASAHFDIVSVCVPAAEQYSVALAALQAGANVLCETPFTGDPARARELIQAAADRERLLMPDFCHRFHPPVLFAREMVANDDLGRITMFRCRFSGLRTDLEEKMPAAAVTTGALLETAIHGVDLFRAFCGEADRICGQRFTVNPDLKVEDTVALVLGNGRAAGVVEASWSSPGARGLLEIYGTAGACLIDYDAGALRYLTADQPVWRGHDESGPNRFERATSHFADAVRGLEPLAVTGEDGLRALVLCSDLHKSLS